MSRMIIPNWAYQKPSKGGHRGLKKLLKYVSYREDPQHERWTDCGLGGTWRSVYDNCVDLKGPYILAHNMVISPSPDLMALIPEAMRHEVVREVTESIIERWHIERGLDIPEYSYVLHSRDTNDTGQEQLHTHCFVAGTIANSLGERVSHRVNREQVVADPYSMSRSDNLHAIAEQEMDLILERTLGRDWQREVQWDLDQSTPTPEISL